MNNMKKVDLSSTESRSEIYKSIISCKQICTMDSCFSESIFSVNMDILNYAFNHVFPEIMGVTAFKSWMHQPKVDYLSCLHFNFTNGDLNYPAFVPLSGLINEYCVSVFVVDIYEKLIESFTNIYFKGNFLFHQGEHKSLDSFINESLIPRYCEISNCLIINDCGLVKIRDDGDTLASKEEMLSYFRMIVTSIMKSVDSYLLHVSVTHDNNPYCADESGKKYPYKMSMEIDDDCFVVVVSESPYGDPIRIKFPLGSIIGSTPFSVLSVVKNQFSTRFREILTEKAKAIEKARKNMMSISTRTIN